MFIDVLIRSLTKPCLSSHVFHSIKNIWTQTRFEKGNFPTLHFRPPTSCLTSYYNRDLYRYYVPSPNIKYIYIVHYVAYLLDIRILSSLTANDSFGVCFYGLFFLIFLLYLQFLLHTANFPSHFSSPLLHWYSILILGFASYTVVTSSVT